MLKDFAHEVSWRSKELQLSETLAIYEITGKLVFDGSVSREVRNKVYELSKKTFDDKRHSVHTSTSLRYGDTYDIIRNDMKIVFRQLMHSQIVMCWTAFETLACDVWICAVDEHPRILALLSGEPKRIGRLARSAGQRKDDDIAETDAARKRGLSLKVISDETRSTFKIDTRMGHLLYSCDFVKFIKLSSIREAYSSAFAQQHKRTGLSGIDESLSSNSLDAISAIRNLIVHKGGVADDEYMACVNRNVGLPVAKEGEAIMLEGKFVGELITEFVDACLKLIVSTDDWISEGAENG